MGSARMGGVTAGGMVLVMALMGGHGKVLRRGFLFDALALIV